VLCLCPGASPAYIVMETVCSSNLFPLAVIVLEFCCSISVSNLALLEEEWCKRAFQSAQRIWKQACPKLLHLLLPATGPFDFTALFKGSRPRLGKEI